MANDKLLEWRKKNWNVGLCTGDRAINVDAPVIVATLETQKRNLLQGIGPQLLVIDEYQMLNDSSRGLNYELAIATSSTKTQLLLMSGSVANPNDVRNWLRRNGRSAKTVSHHKRAVPQEEIHLDGLKGYVPKQIKNYWVRNVIKALSCDLGPILIFAPKRNVSETLAREIAEAMDCKNPLLLNDHQRKLAKECNIGAMLNQRVSYHHSGLSYEQRSKLIEPLAKEGKLQVVVATTGLGAGINFSMKSVLIIDREYRQGEWHQNLRPDELLQMFGRAGRRGLDEKGYILTAPEKPSLREGKALTIKGQNQIDWPSFIYILEQARQNKKDATQALRDLISRLYSRQVTPIGMRNFLLLSEKEKKSLRPKLKSNSEAIPTERSVVEILNYDGLWERKKGPTAISASHAFVYKNNQYHPALQVPDILQKLKLGNLCKFKQGSNQVYGREVPVAKFPDEANSDTVFLIKSFYNELKKHILLPNSNKVQGKKCPYSIFEKYVLKQIPILTHGGEIHELIERGNIIYARLSFDNSIVYGIRDEKGRVLINPPQRTRSNESQEFKQLLGDVQITKNPTSTAEKWYALNLIDENGHPTKEGLVFSYFNHGEGLAISAGLLDLNYPIEDMIWDLANVRAGYRFSDHISSGDRLASCCRELFGHRDVEHYLKKGLPPEYGEGASEVMKIFQFNKSKIKNFLNRDLRSGDIERGHTEWLNLLNNITQSPDLEWPRWSELKTKSRQLLKKISTKLQTNTRPPPAITKRASSIQKV